VSVFFDQLRQKAQREEVIIKIMMIFSAYHYKANPTFEQVGQLVEMAGTTMGITAEKIHYIFASGSIPPELDALIQELSLHWRPSGDIVDTDLGVRWLREGQK